MIDEIFKNYQKQERENFKLLAKDFGIDGEFLSTPNANHDLIVILDSVNLLNEELDSFKVIDDFYEKIVKEGILLGLGFGKAHMIKKVLELDMNKNEIIDTDLEEYKQYFPKFDVVKYDFKKQWENGIERVKISRHEEPSELEIEISKLAFISKLIDKNHKELKKMLFEEFFNEFKIDRKKAKYKFEKRIIIDSEKLKPLTRSRFFKDKYGKYKIKRIIEDYFELMIDTGMEIGIRAGFRLVIEDIKKNIMPYDLLKNLSETEIMMYIQKEHSEYIFKKHAK
ncbi:hypothetical protein SAMN02910297_00136 [Methanobrevibacter olleyae]|uniref:Uncharacterized protein n=1 Tax=Methanobrevibacter olleyae TaxID=294671 RepID=A0A1I4FLP1_METOL|nr:hypothetical protein [Methanobrevibacter olleyae]SFL18835.1 hypothetical protein SAMN02910297_00136 [Methanobrevibacter olleyae]